MSSKVHDFQKSLNKSKALEDSPFWFDLYKQYFPTLVTAMPVRKDGWAQRGGIDRVLVLSDGTILTVDEKIREKDFDDFLLEYYSFYEQKTPGWIEKDLTCDYIAYVVRPSRKCYLLPFQLLRQAWRENHKAWLAQHKRIKVHNRGYTTVSVAVPKKEVQRALMKAMVVTWDTPADRLLASSPADLSERESF